MRRRLGSFLLQLLLVAGSLVMLFPFIWMFSTSVKGSAEALATPPTLWPKDLIWTNYQRVFETIPLWQMFKNSVFVSLVATAVQMITSAMAAYGFARINFRGRDLLFLVYLSTMMIPFQVTVVPLFIEMQQLGLVDTYAGLLLPMLVSAFGVFLMRQAMMKLPKEIEEAALIDGAGHFRIFRSIALPLVAPSMATLGILSFMASWNSFLWPLVITSSDEMQTLPLGLANLHGQYSTDWGLVMAGTSLVVIPIVLVYLVAQRYITQGFVMSGLKG